jgi:hypothetical protein
MITLSVYDQGVFMWDEMMMPEFVKPMQDVYAAQGYEVRTDQPLSG